MNIKSLKSLGAYGKVAIVAGAIGCVSMPALAAEGQMPTSATVAQQASKIKGKVVDAKTGEPIIGASVLVKGTSKGTSTTYDGSFELSGVASGSKLVVSYIGYNAIEIAASDNLTIKITEDSQNLDELVVVGYTVQKKESLTGAMTNIKGDKLKDVTSPSVENLLNGKVSGVYVAPGSGQPGASGAVVIRGQATLGGTTAPLWVIDGVTVGNSAGELNPADIESMTILKDAASTAIYGSQGANGVIVVTTKSGQSGKMSIDVNAKAGVSILNNGNLKVMNGAELYDYYSSFANAETIAFPRWNADLRNSNFDWWDLATQTGFTQEYNVSVRGGNEKIQSFFSLGYYNEEGAVKGYNLDRYNARLKTTFKPTTWLTIKPAISAAIRDVDDQQYSVTSMYSMLPWDSPYDADGNLVPHRYEGWVNSASTNYLYDLQYNHSGSSSKEFMGNIDFDIRITGWLTFSSVNNYRYINGSSNSYSDPRSSSAQNVNGRITEYRSEVIRRYTNQKLLFNKTWNRKHVLSGLVAYEFNDYRGKSLDVYGTGFVPGFEVLDVVAKPERTKGGISEWAVQSYFTQWKYMFDDKYIAEFMVRRDGASNLGDDAKYGNLFAVSAGWIINKEEWFNADWVSNLKLRASYGSAGNRPSSLYPQYDLYSVSTSYNTLSGALISSVGNKSLTWEKTTTAGLGVDASFLNNRFRVVLDLYSKDTDNVLYNVPVSGLTGVTSIYRNIGKMRNTGFELSLGADIIDTKDWFWGVEFNIGHNSNELRDLYAQKNADGTYSVRPVIIGDNSGIAGSSSRILEIGYPVDTYYMKEWAGVNPDNGAPMWYVEDEDGNKETTSNYSKATYTKCGNSSPTVFGGFSTSVSWKNLDLNASFGYSIGGQIYNYSRQEYDSDGTYCDRNQMKLMDGWSRWEKPGDIATHPVAKYNNQDKGNQASSRYLEDNSFLKLRSLSVGYSFKNLKNVGIQNLRLSLNGENLFTITDYSGVDPELPASGGSVMGTAGPSVYPSTRKFMFGLSLTL